MSGLVFTKNAKELGIIDLGRGLNSSCAFL
jgi:hypothetical protein